MNITTRKLAMAGAALATVAGLAAAPSAIAAAPAAAPAAVQQAAAPQAVQEARVAAVAATARTYDTNGGGCRLSANWWVTTSATWYSTELSYTVANSPGALRVVATSSWPYSQSNAGGASSQTANFFYNAAPYIYRANHTGDHSKVIMTIYGGSGYCTSTIYRD